MEGNTPNLIDSTGFIPDRAAVEQNLIRYSCKCGWLDYKHISAAVSKLQVLREALATHINGRSRIVKLSGVIPVGDFLPQLGDDIVQLWAHVPETMLISESTMRGVALGIVTEFDNKYEARQTPGNWVGIQSGFSEEDLPSNWIGYWLNLSRRASDNLSEADIWDILREDCDIMGLEESLCMYNEYERTNSFGILSEWNTRRPRPQAVHIPNGISCHSEAWPSSLFASMNPVAPEGIVDAMQIRMMLLVNTPVVPKTIGRSIVEYLRNTSGWWILENVNSDYFDALTDTLYTVSSNGGTC